MKEAPAKTDCLTSIHYLLKKVFQVDLPRAWIGDMPRELSCSGWNLSIIDTTELRMGDILFLKRKQDLKLIAHIAFAIGPDKIFHCRRDRGAVVETVDEVFEIYEQKLKQEQLKYIDSRNNALREQHSGMYLP